jgi:hypothetical protein
MLNSVALKAGRAGRLSPVAEWCSPWCLLILLFICAAGIAGMICPVAEAKDLKSSDYLLVVKVLAFEKGIVTTGGGGSTSKTDCSPLGDNVNCKTTTTAKPQYRHRTATMQVEIDQRVYVIECISLPGLYAALSKCAPLSEGEYRGRWKDGQGNKLEVVSAKGKSVTFSVVSGGEVRQPPVTVKMEQNPSTPSSPASSVPSPPFFGQNYRAKFVPTLELA